MQGAGLTFVSADYESGNLVFRDKNGAIILTIDGANRKIVVPTGAGVDLPVAISSTEVALADGKVLIGDAAGVAAEQTLSGDVTTTRAGVTAIGAKKVLESMIALANHKILIGDAGGAAAAMAVTGDVTISDSGVTAIGAGKVTFAKAAVFVSTELTGTGSSQNVAHGLGVAPAAVLIVPTDTSPSTVGVYTAVEGTHTTTNVVVTVTSGKKFKVLAWA